MVTLYHFKWLICIAVTVIEAVQLRIAVYGQNPLSLAREFYR